MEDLLKDIETFKGKIENANQLIDESKRLVDTLGVAVEKVVIFDKNAADLEEKYQSINKMNDEKYQDLLKKQGLFFEDWKKKSDADILAIQNTINAKLKTLSILFYIVIGLIVISTLIIKFV